MSMMHGPLVMGPTAVAAPVAGSTVYNVEAAQVVAEP